LTPDGPVDAHARRAWLCRSLILWCGLLLVHTVNGASAQEQRINFDMSAQPLASALVDFADRTGMAALVDGELTSGLRSSPVKGRLTPEDALRVLLAGTGLSIRYAGANAFTVGLARSEPGHASGRPKNGRRADQGVYFSQLQDAVERALCRNDNTRPGRYRAAFQIWVGEGGVVQALHFLASTGDETRDATITALLTTIGVAPPPRDLPQPLTIILQQKASIEGSGCAAPPGLH
jgi:Secretin and TonB N terminus short domain